MVPPETGADTTVDDTTPTSRVTLPGTPVPEVVPPDVNVVTPVPQPEHGFDLEQSISEVDQAYEGVFNIPVTKLDWDRNMTLGQVRKLDDKIWRSIMHLVLQ